MRVIGVIDLLGGRAVHAQGGCRPAYRPVEAVAADRIDGNPATLARVYVDRLGIRELYVADLDAIAGGAEQDEATRAIVAASHGPVWIDAGIATVAQARRAAARGASRFVIGLETLPSFDAFQDIASALSGASAFSLDLRGGQPVAAAPALRAMTPELLAQRAVEAGAASVIVLDLDRIGSARGVDLALMTRVRGAVPGIPLLAGGGVRDAADLRRLADCGCDAALVGTALHTGALIPDP